MNKADGKAIAIKNELIRHRRFFHAHPETGWFTFFTTASIIKKLKKYGYTLKLGREIVKPEAREGLGSKKTLEAAIKRAKELLPEADHRLIDFMEDGLTGVVADINTGHKGPTLAFRFDIDGVDVTESKEDTHRPACKGFRADIDGIAHACGHDGHIAIGLGLAKLISDNLDDFKGKFRFIFQTAEEGARGAVGMESAGILNGVDYLLGGHIGFKATEDEGIICGTNKLLATSKFDVIFTGIPAHVTGAPQDGANALLAVAEAATQMHAITRHAKGVTRINVGVLRAGEGRNIIAPNAYMACETRGETNELNEFMKKKCFDIIEGVSKIHGVTYEIKGAGGTVGGDSSPEITKLYEKVAKESPFIDNDKIVGDYDFGACEDYAHLMSTVQKKGGKSGYFMLGTKLAAGHHSKSFDFNEDCLVTGVDIFLRTAYELNGK